MAIFYRGAGINSYWYLNDPIEHGFIARSPEITPTTIEGTPRSPNLTMELETLVRALRDAEILAHGIIPATCVKNSFDVYP